MATDPSFFKTILPEYAPPEHIWQAVTDELDKPSLENLPQYMPDQKVWQSIERSLDRTPAWWRGVYTQKVAAAVIILLGGLFWIAGSGEDGQVRFSEEALDDRLRISVISEADDQYNRLMEMYVLQEQQTQRPGFSQLLEEYEALRDATHRIQQAAGDFNMDKILVEQHTSLELKKSMILNELSKFI